MNPKQVIVTMFANNYQVAFYHDITRKADKDYNISTDNPLVVGYMINVFMLREHTSEELMEQLIADIA